MTSLEILLMSDNQIGELNVDGGLMNLKRLATLDLTNNNIQHVPPELGNMKQLRYCVIIVIRLQYYIFARAKKDFRFKCFYLCVTDV